LGAYQWWTRQLYGHALFSEAINYATAEGTPGIWRALAGVTALSFTGGCAATAVFFAPLIWRRKAWVPAILVTGIIAVVVIASPMMATGYAWLSGYRKTGVEVQTIFWAIGGVSVLALAVLDFWQRRDAASCLLLLWVLGTFFFAAFLNWTVNARSILPLMPAVAILLVRRLDAGLVSEEKMSWGVPGCLAASAVLALAVVHSDFLLAVAVRQTVQTVAARQDLPPTLWFQGHWGFQYYMQERGAAAFDPDRSLVRPGDWLATPFNNTSLLALNKTMTQPLDTIVVAGPRFLTTWSGGAGAGYYASSRGPVPFAFGAVPTEGVTLSALGAVPTPATGHRP